jgi:hypothetical protein
MKYNKIAIISSLTLAISLPACDGGEKNDEFENKDTTEQILTEPEPQVFYQIPTPNEFFTVIKEIGGAGKQELMNPLANKEKYLDNKSKALNFGVYSADLAYASCYDMGPISFNYFKVVDDMSRELDINAAFDESVFKRIEDNINNGDSLLNISNDKYFEAYSYLEENERGNILSLVVAGGWVESMHIVMSLAGKFADSNPIIERIADQKYTLENIIDFMSKYQDDSDVNSVKTDLAKLLDIFNKAEVSVTESTSGEKDGQLSLSGGTEIKFNKEIYNELLQAVKNIRTKIINAE